MHGTLKDKHGKKIFEGDIVRTKDGDIKKSFTKITGAHLVRNMVYCLIKNPENT